MQIRQLSLVLSLLLTLCLLRATQARRPRRIHETAHAQRRLGATNKKLFGTTDGRRLQS